MKKLIIAFVLLVSLSCALYAAPMGLLFTTVTEPVAATSLTASDKAGESSAFGLFGLIALGDAGISAASKKANITAVHHVDKSTFCLLFGLFTMETTKVYGN